MCFVYFFRQCVAKTVSFLNSLLLRLISTHVTSQIPCDIPHAVNSSHPVPSPAEVCSLYLTELTMTCNFCGQPEYLVCTFGQLMHTARTDAALAFLSCFSQLRAWPHLAVLHGHAALHVVPVEWPRGSRHGL